MPALDERIVIFFIAGLTPTAAESALIARIRGTVRVRTVLNDTEYGSGNIETCDAVAADTASIPSAYSAKTDVTPSGVDVPEDFDVFPATLTVKVGETMHLAASSADLNETTGIITNTDLTTAATVAWASDDVGVATVDTDGIVTGVAAGTCTITATYTPSGESPVTATCAVTCAAATAESVTIGPPTPSVEVGATFQISAIEAKSDGTSSDVSATVGAWSSATPGVATVNADTGIATGVSAGSSVITFDDGVNTDTCTLTVTAVAAASVTVAPATASVAAAATINLYAVQGNSDGTSEDVTATVGAWSSATPAAATVNADTGVVTGVAAGSSVITFDDGTNSDTCTVTCTG